MGGVASRGHQHRVAGWANLKIGQKSHKREVDKREMLVKTQVELPNKSKDFLIMEDWHDGPTTPLIVVLPMPLVVSCCVFVVTVIQDHWGPLDADT